MTKIEEKIKDSVIAEIFSEFPTLDNQHPYDFFMQATIDETETVGGSALREEWGFEVCENFDWEPIRSIRGLMQTKYDDLESFFNTLMSELEIKAIQINKNECVDLEEYENLRNNANAMVHRSGTADEFLVFQTIKGGIN